jgi:hypothetical protein
MMQKRVILLIALPAIYATVLVLTVSYANAQQEKTLHNFNNNHRDGYGPNGGLIMDAAGNLYGTTTYGGTGSCPAEYAPSCGVVFELSPNSAGGWTEKILHNFNFAIARDGWSPDGPLAMDATGNLYGTTAVGGTGSCVVGCGTVFELSPTGTGAWVEKILYSFRNNGDDGLGPAFGVALDAAGNLYGVTLGGGIYTWGTAFELSPTLSGAWQQKILYFAGSESSPTGGFGLDSLGNMYCTSLHGGAYFVGSVFKLTPNPPGLWTETTLYSFGGFPGDGYIAWGRPVFDSAGNLYGATSLGGANLGGGLGDGIAYELTPSSEGSWTETILHSFGDSPTDAVGTASGLVIDATGNLYGASFSGGALDLGTVFELTQQSPADWTETQLHSFGQGSDGSGPEGPLIFDASGNMYAITGSGGAYGYGTVFEITP